MSQGMRSGDEGQRRSEGVSESDRQQGRQGPGQSLQVYAVDGSAYFNRPGPRIVTGVRILAEILQPGRFPRTTPPDAWRRLG